MKVDTWERLKRVFDDALELPPGEREAFARRSARGDDELLRELLELLAEVEAIEEGFLSRSVATRALGLFEAVRDRDGAGELPSLVGDTVGRWRLVREIGRGGMGIVYLAERAAGGFRQLGALKMVGGPAGRELTARFEAERQMLAGLSHPGIARLLDGGSTDDGHPYLVMEYVEGETITRHCARHRLTVGGRIDLVLAICSAVQSAHQSLIVHRDLKPSNILVTADGAPKLLDFGIAKLLEPGGKAHASTRLAALTPEYASPEQLSGRPVSTASDVFSLGVLLYELLTGHRPFGAAGASIPDRVRTMEAGPAAPSAVIAQRDSEAEPTAEEIAGERQTRPEKLRRRLRGDLDAIVLKALRVEPERRYATMEALAEELRRERDGLPVAARGEALAYRTGRFLRRHRTLLAAGLLVAVTLVGATVVSVREARTARQERDRAETVVGALERILWSPNPSWYADGGSTDVTMAAVLEGAREWLPSALGDLPREEARTRYFLGTTLAALGAYVASEQELHRARDLHAQMWGEDHPETAKATSAWGGSLANLGRNAEAEEQFRRVLEICSKAPCEELLDHLVPGASWALGVVLWRQGRDEEAAETFRRALEIRRAQGHGEDRLTANLLISLGNLHKDRGELDEALALYEQALSFTESLQRGAALTRVGEVRVYRGDLTGARSVLEEARTLMASTMGSGHPDLRATEFLLALAEARTGEPAAARERMGAVLTRLRSIFGEQSPEVGEGRWILGEILLETGDPRAAERELAASLSLLDGHRANDWRVAQIRSLLGASLVEQGRDAEGRELLAAGLEGLTDRLGADDPRTRRAAESLERAGSAREPRRGVSAPRRAGEP